MFGLHTVFQNLPASSHVSAWNSLWQQSRTPWDRARSNPALEDALRGPHADLLLPAAPLSTPETPGPPAKKPRALVPGCGAGYDVDVLSRYGFDALGLDSSDVAVEAAWARFRADAEAGGAKEGQGEGRFVKGDFFEVGFGVQGEEEREKFDLIYDYTFLCALPAELRPDWARRMSELLKPGGALVCLEFPLHKEPTVGGPPHGLSAELYVELFQRPGEAVSYDAAGHVIANADISPKENGLQRVARWKAERTHEVGQGHDHVSIWKHRVSTS